MEPEPDADLELRLERLVPARPRPEFRETVLGRVRADLARGVGTGLARPAPWLAVAAALLVLLSLGAAIRSASAARLAAASLPPAGPEAWEVASMLPPGEARDRLLDRLRMVRAAELRHDADRRRWAEHVIRIHEGEVNDG